MTRPALFVATALLILGFASRSSRAECPEITRSEIITLAKSGVGCPYVWGGTCWDPNNKSWKGADCSGYVTVCWQIPAASKTTQCLPHYYTTSTFQNSSTHWTSISRNDLIQGDAMVYNDGSAGHIVLYDSGSKWGTAQVYEAKGTAYGIVYGSKNVSSTYVARRRHRLKAATPTYPLMTIAITVDSIANQARDLCQQGSSLNIFDFWTGQEATMNVDVKNSGTAVALNTTVGFWVEEPYLQATLWNIYSDWKASGSFVLNDTDGLQKIGHSNPGKTFKLWLGSISVGETKRVKVKVKAAQFSLGLVDHPDLRAWVSHVDNYYEKADYSSTFNNVGGYQKQNSGDLKSYAQTDVLAKESCDKRDNDCDGKTDEDGVCGSDGGLPKADKGGTNPGKDGAAPGSEGGGPSVEEAGAGADLAAAPPSAFVNADGCSTPDGPAGPSSLFLLLPLLLLLGLGTRRR